MKTVTFTMPPPHTFCCPECEYKRRDIRNRNTYPVVQIENTDKLECAGGKRVYIKTDCGQVFAFSILYFS